MYIFQQILIFSLLSMLTHNQEKMITTGRSVLLKNIPSGSGLAVEGDTVYIVGDDSPFLFALGPGYELKDKTLLLPSFREMDRIPKPLKPDLESLLSDTSGMHPVLYAFGSGSKTVERDSLLQIATGGEITVEHFSLSEFYGVLMKRMKIGIEDFNLEGAALMEGTLYLFNRGNNHIISLRWNDFRAFLKEEMEPSGLEMEFYPIDLPEINGVTAGFSGACPVPGKGALLFTATVEDTQNWIDDGEILGSFVGSLSVDALEKGKPVRTVLVTNEEGAAVLEKLESVDIVSRTPEGHYHALSVADNDDGASTLLELIISRDFFDSEGAK